MTKKQNIFISVLLLFLITGMATVLAWQALKSPILTLFSIAWFIAGILTAWLLILVLGINRND